MAAQVFHGEQVAAGIKAQLAERVHALIERGVTPGLGTLLVGDDGPSANYVAMKHRDGEELGITSYDAHLPADATQADVIEVVNRLNDDPAVDAYLMQYPFPKHLDFEAALLAVDPAKDVDGLHPVNLGHLVRASTARCPARPTGSSASWSTTTSPSRGATS